MFITKGFRRWSHLPRYRKATHLTRGLFGLLLITASVTLIGANPTVGVAKLIAGGIPFISFQAYAAIMGLCGILLLVLSNLSLITYFLLTTPLLIWVAFSWKAVLLGQATFAGASFITFLYLLLMIVFWGYEEP